MLGPHMCFTHAPRDRMSHHNREAVEGFFHFCMPALDVFLKTLTCTLRILTMERWINRMLSSCFYELLNGPKPTGWKWVEFLLTRLDRPAPQWGRVLCRQQHLYLNVSEPFIAELRSEFPLYPKKETFKLACGSSKD